MSTENIVTGKYYRILKDATNKVWDRVSFWTHADDVSLASGTSLSTDLTNKQTKIDATQTDFAQVESSSTSAHAYTKGQMLIYNNQLYRVKAAIAVGNTLVVGTNIEVVSVSTLSSMLTASNGNQFYFDVKDGTPGFYPTASKTASTFVPFGGTSGVCLLGAQIVVPGASTFNLWIPQDDLPNSISLKTVTQGTTSGCWACMNTVRAQGGIQYSLPQPGNSITFDLSSYVGTTGMWLIIYEKSGYSYVGDVTAWSK